MKIIPLRATPFSSICHLLLEGREAVLIDTGLLLEGRSVPKRLHELGLEPGDLKAILLTHGHLDHSRNLAKLQQWSGAPVYGHCEELAYVEGRFAYRGWNVGCHWLESVGRKAFGFTPGRVDHWIEDGEVLPFLGGIEVLHLPGHSLGHCGFYLPGEDILMSGDLFASYSYSVRLPPRFLNTAPGLIRHSLLRAASKNPAGMVPNHYDKFDPVVHRRRFDLMCRRMRII